MCGSSLLKIMKEDVKNGLCPAFVVATLGTTGLCAFDDLESITEVIVTNYLFLRSQRHMFCDL